jgi:hypothetical protein
VWNQERIDLFGHLAGVISSEVNHLVESAENRKTLQAADDKMNLFSIDLEDPETAAIRRCEEQEFLIYLEKKETSTEAIG